MSLMLGRQCLCKSSNFISRSGSWSGILIWIWTWQLPTSFYKTYSHKSTCIKQDFGGIDIVVIYSNENIVNAKRQTKTYDKSYQHVSEIGSGKGAMCFNHTNYISVKSILTDQYSMQGNQLIKTIPLQERTIFKPSENSNSRPTSSCLLYGSVKPKSNIKVAFEKFPYLISTWTSESSELQNYDMAIHDLKQWRALPNTFNGV